MPFETAHQAENFIFSSYMRVQDHLSGPDALTRTPALTRRLLDNLGQPDHGFASILVTGSKGKGSISALTARLLQALGHKVGLVTSPHILDFRERIRINGRAISEAELVEYVNRLEQPASEIMAELTGERYLSPTGLILAVSSLYFADNEVEFAVIEAGRGGRFDDCVVLDNPVALFGPMMLEHTVQLGPTLADIASQKVALLKRGGVGVSVPQEPEVQLIMQTYAAQNWSGLLFVGRDLQVVAPRIEEAYLHLGVQLRANEFEDLALPIPALYEAENLAVALGAVEIVADEQVLRTVRKEELRAALLDFSWPGRMQILAENPFTLLDCAVTGQSARAVLESLGTRLQKPVYAVVGVPEDRDWRGVLDEIAPYCDLLVLSKAANQRLRFPAEAAAYARAHFSPACPVEESASFSEAQSILARYNQPATLLFLGTQSFAADVLKSYGCNTEQLWA
ncbi:MAG TPA: hypothetical protein VH186_11305 [Chloroflexia bacterium]|nr:hypothetical protein [Chloroflexia bacterium]